MLRNKNKPLAKYNEVSSDIQGNIKQLMLYNKSMLN